MDKLIIFTIILLILPIVIADVSYDFNSNETFASDGWTLIRPCAAHPDRSVPSPFDANNIGAFGLNGTYGCGGVSAVTIRRSHGIDYTGAIMNFDYSFSLEEDNISLNIPMQLHFSHTPAGAQRIRFEHHNNGTFTTSFGSSPGAVTCTHHITRTMPYNITSRITIDAIDNRYTWQIDGSTLLCDELSIGTAVLVPNAITLTATTDDFGDSVRAFFDESTAFDAVDELNNTAPTITEFEDAVESIWTDFGVNSTGSRTLMGVLLLLVFMLTVVGLQMQIMKHVSAVGTGILTVVGVVILVYVNLLPQWIMYMMILLAIAAFGATIWLHAKGT